jgi:hypothetical protein
MLNRNLKKVKKRRARNKRFSELWVTHCSPFIGGLTFNRISELTSEINRIIRRKTPRICRRSLL